MHKKPILMVCAFNEVVKQHVCANISGVIGHVVDVLGCSEEERFAPDVVPDLVLTTGRFGAKVAKTYFPGVPVLHAVRVLTGTNLEQVMSIPVGTRVLVISNPQGVVEEAIEMLRQAGINHITYEPYWLGKNIDVTQFDYAITPGMRHVCTHQFKHLIDIQPRIVSMRTFVQILLALNIDLQYADIYETRYLRTHIATCRKALMALESSEVLRQRQTQVLNQIDDAIIYTTDTGTLLFANQLARRWFHIDNQLSLSASLKKMVNAVEDAPLQDSVNAYGIVQRVQETVVTIDEIQYFCRKSIMEAGDAQRIYTVRRIEQIQEADRSLRGKLYVGEYAARHTFRDIWGTAPELKQNKSLANIFAKTDQTILITGESGTGKEMLAQAIHNASPRAKNPFVGINLSSLPPTLVESELFGYEPGAFTGARKGGKAGLFETANHGTLFLDEIGDIPLSLQILLLRVIEERVIVRVGSLRQTPIDVRIIAATNQPLQELMAAGKFRSDLYYRLNVLSINTLPVRKMKDDIIPYFQQYCQNLSVPPLHFSDETIRFLTYYSWPGNFRELKNVAEYLHYTVSPGEIITPHMLPKYLLQDSTSTPLPTQQAPKHLELLIQSPLLLQILRLLRQASPRGVGRGQLSAQLAQTGFPASEQEVRRCLLMLRERDLVFSGTTRQGTTITEAGSSLLSFYDEISSV